MRSKYLIRPLSHGMDSSSPSLHLGTTFSPLTKNNKVDQNSVKKRWGYATSERDLGAAPLNIVLYQQADGDRYTIYLTATDACLKKTGAGETFSYITDTYTTGTITSVAGTGVSGSGTEFSAAGVAAGDQFIMDDDHSANVEPDTNWATVASVESNTGLTLSSAYTGSASTGTYKIRRVYSTPTNERWTWAVVDDKLCFGNGNTLVQYWAGSGYATSLNALADGARYMVPYANRLVIADYKVSSVRNPNLMAWSKEGDPTDWTDSTAGTNEFIDTEDYIMGLSVTGSSIVVYKRDSINIGDRTGIATAPIELPTTRKPGTVAPYSIASVAGTNFWLGEDDFYALDGDYPRAIGEKMRYRFYDVVDPTEAKNTWSFVNNQENEIMWFANTSAGQVAFVYDYKTGEWYLDDFAATITAAGRGAV